MVGRCRDCEWVVSTQVKKCPTCGALIEGQDLAIEKARLQLPKTPGQIVLVLALLFFALTVLQAVWTSLTLRPTAIKVEKVSQDPQESFK